MKTTRYASVCEHEPGIWTFEVVDYREDGGMKIVTEGNFVAYDLAQALRTFADKFECERLRVAVGTED